MKFSRGLKGKYLLILSAAILMLATACSDLEPKEPEFITMERVRVTDISRGNVTIEGNAILWNPNPIGLDLAGFDIDVTVNEIDVGKARQTSTAVDIKPDANFTIPLAFDFNTKQVLGDLILGVLGALINQSVDVTFDGTMKFKALDIEFTIPVEYEEEVPLKEEGS